MQPARFFTSISRKKLQSSCIAPDCSAWESVQEVRETPESYYHPAVELLDTILKKRHKH